MYLSTKALVLRSVNYKEADKMLTLLSEKEGKISASARGVLRKTCKYTAAAQQLCYGEYTLLNRNGRWTVNQAETHEQFLGLRDDLEKFALGCYIAELMEALSDEDCPNSEMLSLGLNSLYALSHSLYSDAHIKAVFELRLMCIAGYQPFLDSCAVCGAHRGEDMRFSLNGGAMHCIACPSGSAGVSMPLCESSRLAMQYIAMAEPKKIFSFELDELAMDRLINICEGYVLAQLERGFKSLDYYKSIRI